MGTSDYRGPRAGVRIAPLLALVAIGTACSAKAEAEQPMAAAASAGAVPPSAPASAQRASVIAPRLLEAVRAGRPVEVGIFGDSFSDGAWWALDQEFRNGHIARIHRLGRPSTGFTNYRRLDLGADVRRKLDTRPIDVAIIVFGANDTQPLHGAEKPTPFLSDDWKRVVGARLEEMLALFRERGTAVLWVGLPKMRPSDYDQRVRRLDAYFKGEMERHAIAYIDTVGATSDASGGFVADLRGADGSMRRARADDGIHMTTNGYRIFAAPLAARLRALIDEARRAVAQQD